VVYLDDLTVFSKKRGDHLHDLLIVLQHCREHDISLNPKKSIFAVTEGKLLGHIVSKDGIKIDPERVREIQQLSLPTTKSNTRSFFSQVNFLRRFIPDFAELTRHIIEMMKNHLVFKWSVEGKKTFEDIKRAISNVPNLVHHDFQKDFIIYCYASKHTLSTILLQKNKQGI